MQNQTDWVTIMGYGIVVFVMIVLLLGTLTAGRLFYILENENDPEE